MVEKYGYIIDIIHTELEFEEASQLETYYINMFGRIDIGTVNLVNLTNGGEGCVGYIHTNESKNKIKEHWANYRGFDLPENIEDYKKEYNRRYSRKYRENDIIKEKCKAIIIATELNII